MKLCNKCNTKLPLDNFGSDKGKSDGKRTVCKECTNKAQQIRKAEKSKEKKLAKEVIEKTSLKQKSSVTKTCNKCQQVKSIDDFPTDKYTKGGVRYECRMCHNAYAREYKRKKKSCIPTHAIPSVSLDAVPIGTGKWDKEKERVYMNNYMKHRYKTNVNYNVKSRLAARIRQCMYNSDFTKHRTMEHVGCTVDFFRKWIESLFTNGMSWNNMGKWHFDHIRPCDSYDFNNLAHVSECFNWSNIRPLMGCENIRKSNMVDQLLIEKYKQLAKNFSETHKKSIDVPS
jgi:hypothetical protein